MRSKQNAFRHLLALAIALPFIAASSVATANTIVTLVGDSITDEDTGRTTYPSRLQTLLGGDFVVNEQGVSGATLREDGSFPSVPYISTVEYTSALASTPDIVVIMLGTNDGRFTNWVPGPGPTPAADVFVNDYDSLIADFVGLPTNPEIFVVTPPPIYSNASTSYDRDAFNNVIVSLIRDPIGGWTDVTLIDLHAVFLAQPGCGDVESTCSLLPDGIHPKVGSSDMGSQLIADTIAAGIIGASIPEPSTLLLLAAGLLVLARRGWRQR